MQDLKISMYHNPKCSKSRATLALLKERGIAPEIISYLDTPPTEAELLTVLKKLKLPVTDMLRFKEDEANTLGLKASDKREDSAWLEILSNHPKLLERPIVFTEKSAVIGRPPENVLDLLD